MNVLFVVSVATQSQDALKDHLAIKFTGIIQKACTPVRLFAMHPWLMFYPDKGKAQLLIEGFSTGFKLPIFTGSGCQLSNNLKSVSLHTDILRNKLMKSISAKRIAENI